MWVWPLLREDVPSVRYFFKQRVGLLCYAFACLSSMYNPVSHHHSVALTCRPTELHGRSTTVTELSRLRAPSAYFWTDPPKVLRGQKAHNRGPEPHVMTLDLPGRPESRITLVRLKDLYPAHLRESLFANLSSHQIYGPTKHVLDGILILSHGTIALVNPVDNSSSSVE
jgi:hypothetical protein